VPITYNVQPINLIPDFIPVIGIADITIVLIWVLPNRIRAAGVDAVSRDWI